MEILVHKLQLTVSCRNLYNALTFSPLATHFYNFMNSSSSSICFKNALQLMNISGLG